MTFFVDTNVIVYAASDVGFRDACVTILERVAQAGSGRTSTAVFEEVWHLERRGRLTGLDGLAAATYDLFTPLLSVTDSIVARALTLGPSPLGANDRLHVATCQDAGIDTIVTVDGDFDGIRGLRRVDPREPAAVRRLLRS
ncbi:MAG TPA: type II toxin-antitoxin system VapC family toxin [Nitriliruptorales bacterium]